MSYPEEKREFAPLPNQKASVRCIRLSLSPLLPPLQPSAAAQVCIFSSALPACRKWRSQMSRLHKAAFSEFGVQISCLLKHEPHGIIISYFILSNAQQSWI
jgi:hypothetical protein